MTEAETLFTALRQATDPDAAAAVERLVRDGPDHALNRVNALAFAQEAGLNEERPIAALLHAARIGLFELSWNVLCPRRARRSRPCRATPTTAASAAPVTSRPSTTWSR